MQAQFITNKKMGKDIMHLPPIFDD